MEETKEIKEIRLPFGETIKRSIMFSLLNLETFIKLSAFWFLIIVYEAATGFPSLCSIDESCTRGLSEIISSLLPFIAGISIMVAFCRNIILKEEASYKIQFGKRELKALGYGIMFVLAIIIPSIVIVIILSILLTLVSSKEFIIPFMIIAPIAIAILLSGLALVFPAIAVDNKMSFKEAFRITKENGARIFFGQVFVILPFLVLVVIISFLFGLTGLDTFATKFIFATMLLLFSFFGTFLRASFYAHMYQYFMYFEEKRK